MLFGFLSKCIFAFSIKLGGVYLPSEKMPIEDITDILNLTAGFVEGHARGGRSGEILYLINGVPAIDPMFNSFDTDIPETAIAETDIRYIFVKQLSILGSTMGSHDDFDKVLELLKKKEIRPVIDSIISLSDGKNGYERMNSGKHFGKIVIKP